MNDPLDREMAEAFLPVFQDLAKAAGAIVDSFGGTDELNRLTAAAQQERAQWAIEHPLIAYGEHCQCWCRKRGHDGRTCTHRAETMHLANDEGVWLGTRETPMCNACSSAIDEQTEIARSVKP